MVDISERSLEEAVETALLRHGPDAPAEPGIARQTPSAYGDVARATSSSTPCDASSWTPGSGVRGSAT
jgi:hypothetical protein